MVIRRKAAFTAITDEDDDQDKVTSYCPSCKEYGFNRLMGERIYPHGESKPLDHENWLCCHACGTIVSKVHAKRQDEITGIKEPDNNPHDYPGKLAISTTHNNKHSSSSHAKTRTIINQIKKTRPGANRSRDYVDVDSDLRNQLSKGKTLVSYNSTNDEIEG